MKKIAVVILLGIFCMPVYSQNVVKNFYKQQRGLDNPQYMVRNKKDLADLIRTENEKPSTETDIKTREFFYGNADRMEVFVGMDPDDQFMQSMPGVGVIPGMDKIGEIVDSADVNSTYTMTFSVGDGESVETVYTQDDLDRLKKEKAEFSDPELLKKLMKGYEELAVVQSGAATFGIYLKDKGKKTTNIVVRTQFMGMFILMELSGKWETKRMAELLTDEGTQKILFSAKTDEE